MATLGTASAFGVGDFAIQKILGKKRNKFERGLGGASSGAATGAMIGSVVPGIGTLAGAGIGGGIGLLSGLLSGGQDNGQPSEDVRRAAFERVAGITRRDASNLASETNSRLGQSLAARGLNDSPAAAGIAAHNRTAIETSALDRVAQGRFAMENQIANQDFMQKLSNQQMNAQLAAAFTELGATGLMQVFTNPQLKDELSQMGVWDSIRNIFSTGATPNTTQTTAPTNLGIPVGITGSRVL